MKLKQIQIVPSEIIRGYIVQKATICLQWDDNTVQSIELDDLSPKSVKQALLMVVELIDRKQSEQGV